MSDSEDQETFKVAQYIMDGILTSSSGYKGHGHDLYPALTLLSATTSRTAPVPASVTFRLRIPEAYDNRAGNLHGGATAMIFDNLSSVALGVWAACVAEGDMQQRWVMTGVSRTINTSYLRAVKVGTEVDVICEVIAVGKRLALVRGHMLRSSDGKMVATCEHHKATPDLVPVTKL